MQQTTIAKDAIENYSKTTKKHQNQPSPSLLTFQLSAYTFHISASPSPSHSTTPPPTQTAQNSPFTFHLSH